ncbi:MAG: carboxypeptidase regulatory-like domain-containing protein [Gemmatimonadota bacterium]
MPRLRGLLLVLAALLASRAVPAHAAGDPDEPPETLVEVQIERGPRAVVAAVERDSTMLLPVRQFLALAELKVTEVRAGELVAGVLEPRGVRFRFDTWGGSLHRGEETRALPAAAFEWRGSELYVDADLLAWALGLTVTTDWAELTARFSGTDDLPVVRRIEREQRRQALLGIGPAFIQPVRVASAARSLSGAVLDWAYSAPTGDPIGESGIELGLGLPVLGGNFDARYVRQANPTGAASETLVSWTRAWPRNPWLRQVRIGDFVSSARRPQTVRGLELTNQPYLRNSAFGAAFLGGRLPAGWEVDAYSDSRYLGSASIDSTGAYRLGVPLQYGQNPVDLIAYGPNGEVLRQNGTFVVPLDRLPGGRFEYDLYAGQCRAPSCDGAASASARYGISNAITVEAGADYYVRADSLGNAWHPYALAAMAPFRTTNLTVETIRHGFTRGRVDFDPSPELHIDVGHTVFHGGVVQPLLGSATERQRTEAVLFWNPFSVQSNLLIQAAATRRVGRFGTQDTERLGVTTRLAAVRIFTGLRREGLSAEDGANTARYGADAGFDATLAGPRLRGTFVRGEASVETGAGLSRVLVGVGRPLGNTLRLDAALGWNRLQRNVILDLSLTATLPSVRASLRNQMTTDGRYAGASQVEGSIMWDRTTHTVSFGPGRTVGQAGITGIVFYDLNANGKRDPGEEGAASVVLQVGSRGITTDSTGRFRTWDVVAFEDQLVMVDSLSIPDPRWVAAQPALTVQAPPNGYTPVQVALVPTGQLSGRVELADRTPVGNAVVTLRHIATGRVTRVTTFADGEFYLMALRPGAYEVGLDPATSRQLGLTLQPISIDIVAGVEQAPLVMHPSPAN